MKNNRRFRFSTVLAGLLAVVTLLLLAACVVPSDGMATVPVAEGESEAPSENSDAQLTMDQLANATYSGIYDEPVTLTDGMYEGEPFDKDGASRPTVTLLENTVLYGDLNGDGVDDAAVFLAENSGGSGVFTYVGAQINQEGQPVDAGTVMLGDRTQVADSALAEGQIVIDMVTQGPDDAMCCPTLMVRATYALQDGLLAQVDSEDTGNASLDTLMGTSWTLATLAQDQPVLADAPITAMFADDQIAGSSGCNNYGAGVSSNGGQNLTVGPAFSTMMACPDPAMAQETSYLQALAGTQQWSLFFGQLAISYLLEDGTFDTMYYDPAQSEDAGTDGDSAASPAEYSYQCNDDVTIEASFDNENRTATVTLPDGTLVLPQVEAASGAKYSDGTTTLWTKGNEAFVQVNDETVIDGCVTQ